MEQYRIKGGRRLGGSVRAAGAKNAALPILAAALLTEEACLFTDCPDISDVCRMRAILESLGCRLKEAEGGLSVDASSLSGAEIPRRLMESMRSSVFTAGPLLSRLGKAEFFLPGGCRIGKRPIDLHLSVLAAFGARIRCEDARIVCEAGSAGLHGTEIRLPFPSVGVTENAMTAAVCARGRTTISGAAREPEIVDLAAFLQRCGAKIEGAGSETVHIEGVARLHGAAHRMIPDRIEGGTFLTAAAVTGGEIFLEGGDAAHMEALLETLSQMGCRIERAPDGIGLRAPERLRAPKAIETAPHPGFPTDMQPQIMAAAALADGVTPIRETIFEQRFGIAKELVKMGARIAIHEKDAIIEGVSELRGCTLAARDLRGGAALVLAALAASGESTVQGLSHIDRGYCRFEERLTALGAEIRRVGGQEEQ